MDCVSQDHLLAFLSGSLDPDQRRAIEQHLDGCAECLELVTLAGKTSIARDTRAEDTTKGARSGAARTAGDADYQALVTVDPVHYVIGSEIARGGMGRILAARDRRLGRPVAIKELLDISGDLRARFEREARITARLQHPAIVNVLEAGAWPHGEPFYAMKLVSGESLDQVIARRPRLEARMGLLSNVIQAVDALSYAHNIRIIHRDLKPSNVLVGEFGETVVIDWGLAKDLGDPGAVPDLPIGPYRTPSAASGKTIEGTVIGTPAYMPPEQARGGSVDERADVYALGAMLYHVLAGAPPYAGQTSDAILDAVIAGPPPPLDTRTPGVPRDLLAIVTKAMAPAPSDRYPTAKELADDLKKFQTGQLVGARAYSAWHLLRRWIARHRMPVAVAGVALVLLGVLGAVSLRRIVREQDRTEAQRLAADEHRDEAQDLMSFMLVDLRDKLQPLGRLDLLDVVANKAVTYYDRRGLDVSEAELGKIALARRNLGDVLSARGDADAALRQYRAALAVDESLASKEATTERRRALAVGHRKVGTVLLAQGDLVGAEAEFQGALAIRKAVAATDPSNGHWQREVAIVHGDIGDVLRRQGHADRALIEYRAYHAVATTLATKDPTNADWQRDLAVSHGKLGSVLLALGDGEGGLRELQAARVVLATIVAKDPANAGRQRDLLISLTQLSSVADAQGETAAALETALAARSIAEALAAKDPTNADRQRDLGVAHAIVGNALLGRGDQAGALRDYRAYLDIVRTLATSDPTNADRQRDVAIGHGKVGNLLESQGELKGALAEYRASLAVNEGLASIDPTNADLQFGVSIGHDAVGDVLREQRDPAGALVAYRASRTIRERLVAKDPRNTDWQRALSVGHDNVGDALLASRDATGALAAYRASIEIRARLAAKDPANATWQIDLAEGHQKLGDALTAKGEIAGGRAAYQTGLEVARQLKRSAPDHPVAPQLEAVLVRKLGAN